MERLHKKRHTLAITGLILVMIIWGSSFAVTKISLNAVPPILFATLRFVVASIVLFGIQTVRGTQKVKWRKLPWGWLSLMGLSGVALFYTGQNLALMYTTTSQSVLILSSVPAVTAILAVVFLGERISLWRGFGVGISVLGVAIVIFNSPVDGAARNPALGALFLIGAGLSWAFYTLIAKRLVQEEPLLITACSTGMGTIFLGIFSIFELTNRGFPTIPATDWLSILYLGLASSAMANLLYNWSLTQLDASQTASYINLVPVVGVLIGVVFLGEVVIPLQLVGGAAVILGVWLST